MAEPDVLEGEFTEAPAMALAVAQPKAKPARVVPELALVDPEGHPWDRMRGESAVWFARLDAFRRLDPAERTIARVYREECQRLGRPVDPKAPAPANWHTQAALWRWRDRATAFDDFNRTVRDAEERNVREAARQSRINGLKGLRGKLLQGMQQMPLDELNWTHVVRGLPAVMAALREEEGLPDGVKGKEADGPAVKVVVGVSMEKI